jgi:membrane fusion protein, multidrug efflux system
MFARVNTVFSINDAALVVPEESIVPQGGRQFVIKAVTPDQVPSLDASKLPEEVKFVSLRQEVRLGIRRAGRVEIVSGLEEGQSVVVAGHQRLQRDGTALRVVELGSRPPQGGGGQGGGQGSAQGGQGGPAGPGGPAPAASAPVAMVAPAPSR